GSALVLLSAFIKMTGSILKSGLIALLFALHPLNVESVVWISERKGVLSTFFFCLLLFSYASNAKRPSRISYCSALIFFVLGLLAKPMLVTVPVLLLLLDYWPLGRIQPTLIFQQRSITRRILLEKLPFVLLALVFIGLTF